MSDIETAVTRHYTGDGSVIERILVALEAAGLDPDRLDPSVLAGVDEFHLGGRLATEALIADLALDPGCRVLDVGCGIGGAARTLAAETGGTALGIDLTPAFVEAATLLSERTGTGDRTSFRVGSALALDADDASFDAVTMLHVGMNIEDKSSLMAELARVVRPGGSVAVYDVMRIADGDLPYPMPWSSSPSTSFVATPEDYLASMRGAGLEPGSAVDRRGLVADATKAAAASPSPVDLRALVGSDFPARFANIRQAIGAGTIAPMQIIARRS